MKITKFLLSVVIIVNSFAGNISVKAIENNGNDTSNIVAVQQNNDEELQTDYESPIYLPSTDSLNQGSYTGDAVKDNQERQDVDDIKQNSSAQNENLGNEPPEISTFAHHRIEEGSKITSVNTLYNGNSTFGQSVAKLYVDGELVYCVEPGTIVNGNADFSSENLSDSGVIKKREITRISYYGYGFGSHSSDMWYAATQIAIWKEMGATISGYDSSIDSMISEINNLVADWSVQADFGNDDIVLTGYGEDNAVTLTDRKGVFSEYFMVEVNGLEYRRDGNNLILWATEGQNGEYTIEMQKMDPNKVGAGIVYVAPNTAGSDGAAYGQDLAKLEVDEPLPCTLNITVNGYGSLNIAKQDEDGTYIPNTKFKVSYNADMSNPLGTYTTGDNGMVLVENVNPTTVYIQEVEVPAPYVLDSTVRSTKVTSANTAYFTATNNFKTGNLQIQKVDAKTGGPVNVAGAEFAVYNPQGAYMTTITTNANGIATLNTIRYGSNYYFVETKAPSNYTVNATPVYFNITTHGATVKTSIANNAVTGKLTIVKTDSETGANAQGKATLNNSVYSLYAAEDIKRPDTGAVVHTKDKLIRDITLSDRTATISGLYLGRYYWVEKTAPTGYNLSTKQYPVTLSYQGQSVPEVTVNVTATDDVIKGSVEITKKDVDTSNAVLKAGAQFDIYRKSTNALITTITTNTNGVARANNLVYDDYYFTERLAPNAYTQNKEKTYFSITKQGEVVKQQITNKRVIGTLNITKVDVETDTAQGDATLENAIYGLYAKADIINPDTNTVKYAAGTKVTELKIKNGKASVTNLYLGSYYLKEISAPKGYLLSDTKTDVTFTYSNQTIANEIRNVELSDQVMKQAFKIAKFGSQGEPGPSTTVKGAEFTYILNRYVIQYGDFDKALAIAKANDGRIKSSEWGVMTTNEEGTCTSKELPYGNYFVRETKVPENFEASTDFYVPIEKDSREPLPFIYVNDPIYETILAVVKMDSETGNIVRVPNAKFKIKALTDTVDFKAGEYVHWWVWSPLPHQVNEFETTEDGTFMTPEKLKPGAYQLEEITAPDGYLINKTSKPFTISKSGFHQQTGPDGTTIITTVTFSDNAVKGKVKLDKQAEIFKGYTATETEYGPLYEPIYETGMLPNVKYEIRAKTDIIGLDGNIWYREGNIVETLTTDGNNITSSSLLPLGSKDNNLYTIQEIETEEGYVLDPTVRTFRFDYVDENTGVVQATWMNEEGEDIETTDILTVNNEKQMALAVSNKEIEQAQYADTDKAYEDVVFGAYTADDAVDSLAQDSLVGLSDVDDEGFLDFKLSRAGNYYLQELATNPMHEIDSTKYPFSYAYNGDKITLIMANDGEPIYNYLKRGSVEIMKTDQETNKPLVNVHYELATDKDFTNIIKETATDENGRAIFEELEKGTYFIREQYDGEHDMATEGYVIDPTVHEVTIEDNEQVITLTLENQPVKGKVQFTKTGESFNRVDIVEGNFGTEYHPIWENGALLGSFLTIEAAEDILTWDGTLWYEKGQEVTVLESDWDTVDSLLLPVGKYVAYESKAPHGYIIDEARYEFEIEKNGLAEVQLNKISIANTRANVIIDIHKAMEEQSIFVNEEAYKDVVFGLYAREGIYDYMGKEAIEPGSLLGTSTINENGDLTQTYDLPVGTYYFKELATNDQYLLGNQEYDFEIGYRGSIIKEYEVVINNGEAIQNYLKRGSVEIIKTDKESEKPLVNVHYELATDKDFTNIIKETATDENGKAIFEDLEKGTYFIREQYDGEHDMVLEGYVKDEKIHEVSIVDDKQVISLSLENQPVKGKVQFIKTGESFNKVEIKEGIFGKEYHPIWEDNALLGSYLTIEAAEDILTWDGTLWYEKGQEVTVLESDWDMVESCLLPVGKYVAYESKAPHGYIIDETRYEFEIEKNGLAEVQLNEISIVNQRASVDINISKVLESQDTFIDEDAYKDVVFGLYAREGIYDYMGNVAIEPGSLVGTSTIDENGELTQTYDLPNGTYYFKELSTNEQYQLSDQEYDFEIGYQGPKTTSYTVDINDGKAIQNDLIRGTIEVLKTSKDQAYYSKAEQAILDTVKVKDPGMLRNDLLQDDMTYLANVPFELATDKEFKNIIKTDLTDVSGRIVFDGLERGTYFVREKASLDFYELNDTIFEVVIERDGQFETVDVENNLITSYVDIKKVNLYDQEETLPFAGFTMYSDEACTQEIRTIRTDESGIAHFDGIKFGSTVYLKETSAPTGYELSDQIVKVTIDEDWVNGDKDTRVIVFPDQPLPVIQVVTGDYTQTMMFSILSVLSGGAIIVLLRRKRKQNI